MRIYRSLIGACIAAIGLCFSGWGFASELNTGIRHDIVRYALATCGDYGADVAKFKAEQTYMVGFGDRTSTVTGSLTAESNGYRLSELVNVSVNDSEVAKGKIGVGAGSVA